MFTELKKVPMSSSALEVYSILQTEDSAAKQVAEILGISRNTAAGRLYRLHKAGAIYPINPGRKNNNIPLVYRAKKVTPTTPVAKNRGRYANAADKKSFACHYNEPMYSCLDKFIYIKNYDYSEIDSRTPSQDASCQEAKAEIEHRQAEEIFFFASSDK